MIQAVRFPVKGEADVGVGFQSLRQTASKSASNSSAMSGERDLELLIANLSPMLSDQEFVFCVLPDDQPTLITSAFCVVRESEGITVILERTHADNHSLPFEGVFRRITLQVHSSLQAVGLTALVARRLADEGISANVVAGYFHDHVFVPADRAHEAVNLLQSLVKGSNADTD